VAGTTEDLAAYWFCPKDGSQLTEVTRGEGTGGMFEVRLAVLEVAIANAEAVGKLDPEQVEEAMTLARKLLESGDRESITLVSVECPSCNFKAVAPLAMVTVDEKTYEKQIKTVRKVIREAERTRKRVGERPSYYRWIWYFLIFGGGGVFIYYLLQSLLG